MVKGRYAIMTIVRRASRIPESAFCSARSLSVSRLDDASSSTRIGASVRSTRRCRCAGAGRPKSAPAPLRRCQCADDASRRRHFPDDGWNRHKVSHPAIAASLRLIHVEATHKHEYISTVYPGSLRSLASKPASFIENGETLVSALLEIHRLDLPGGGAYAAGNARRGCRHDRRGEVRVDVTPCSHRS